MGDRPGEQMNGVVVIDKPAQMSSAQVVATVKRTLKARKVGHTGTLDPFATGILVCCVNRATRLARFITHGRKGYEAVMHLGVCTDSQDFTGKVVSRQSIAGVTEEKVKASIQRLVGQSRQTPPSFSALKHQGKPLYKLARDGIFVQKAPRSIHVYEATVLGIDYPFVHFRVICSPGTYVRTLCADIGEFLGCGGHLSQLRRTQNGGFTLEDAVSLDVLKSLASTQRAHDCVIPMEKALNGVPEVQVGNRTAAKIRKGAPLTEGDIGLSGRKEVPRKEAPWLKVTDVNRRLLAVLDVEKRGNILPYMCVFLNEN